ncbi:hypothetical protein C0389_00350 [bacterium]|nr:hypothetical protein [bacterium]
MINEIAEPENKAVKKRKIECIQEIDFLVFTEELTIPRVRLSMPILTLEIPIPTLNMNGVR